MQILENTVVFFKNGRFSMIFYRKSTCFQKSDCIAHVFKPRPIKFSIKMKLKQYPNCSRRFQVKKIFLLGVMT